MNESVRGAYNISAAVTCTVLQLFPLVAFRNRPSLWLPASMSNYGTQSYPEPVQAGSSGSAFHEPDPSAGDEDPDNGKKKAAKRRKVNHACLYCRRSHMTCDEGRPCQRW